MSQADPFPDLTRALVKGLPPRLVAPNGPVKAGTETKGSLEADLPFVRVQVLDAPDDGVTRRNLVNIEVFASTYATAYAVAEQVGGVLRSTRVLDGIVIDRVLTSSGPKQVPWDNDKIKRFLGAYWLSTRR